MWYEKIIGRGEILHSGRGDGELLWTGYTWNDDIDESWELSWEIADELELHGAEIIDTYSDHDTAQVIFRLPF